MTKPQFNVLVIARHMLVLCAALFAWTAPARAQASGHLILSLATGSAFLGSGDQTAVMHSAAVVRPINNWLAVRAGADYLNSTNRSFEGVPFDVGDFQERVFWAGALGLEVTPLRMKTGGVEHRFGAFIGLTAWDRNEEKGRSVCYPACVNSHPESLQDISEHLKSNERLYTFEYDDGPGGEQDGTYALVAFSSHGRELGATVELSYGFAFKRILPSLRVGFRDYAGHSVLSSSVSLGIRL